MRCDTTLAFVKLQRGLKLLESEDDSVLPDEKETLTIPIGMVFLTSLRVHSYIQNRLRNLCRNSSFFEKIEASCCADSPQSLASTSIQKLQSFLGSVSETLKRPIFHDWTPRERIRSKFMTTRCKSSNLIHSEHLFVYRSNSPVRKCRFCKIEAFPMIARVCWILTRKFGGTYSFQSAIIPTICSYMYELSCSAGLPEMHVPFERVLESVLPINLIALFTCVLLDIPVVATSKNPSRVTDTMETTLSLLYPLPVDRLRVYVPLCPESTIRTVVQAPFPFVVGTIEVDVVKECVDPEKVIVLNLDETNEVKLCRDITKRFADADAPLLPPRFLRRIVRAVYQAFPRASTNSVMKEDAVKTKTLLHKRTSNGLIRWVTDRFLGLTKSPTKVTKSPYSSSSTYSTTSRALQLMASSDENEGSTVMAPETSLRYEKLFDSSDVLCCPHVSNEWKLESTSSSSKRRRIKFVRWSFSSVLASLIKFYPFHMRKKKEKKEKSKRSRRTSFRSLFDKGAFLAECRHSDKERMILDRIVDTQLFHAFIRDRLKDQSPTSFEKWCLHKLMSISSQRSSFVLKWKNMSGFVWKLPRGTRAPTMMREFNDDDDDDDDNDPSIQKIVHLSGWRRRYVYICKRDDDGVFVLRYHDASKVEYVQNTIDWKLATQIRDTSKRNDATKRLLMSSFKGEFVLSKNPSRCQIRLLNDNQGAKYKTPHALEIISEVDHKGSVVLSMETSEERMLWIRTLKGIQHGEVAETLKLKRISCERKLAE